MGTWTWYALLAAISTASTDALIKKYLSFLSPVEMAMARFVAPVPLLVPLLFLTKIPHLSPTFWSTVVLLVPLEFTAMFLYMNALRTSQMSLSIPMLAFSPSFIVVTGWLILGEDVSFKGFCGIMSTVFGAYLLHVIPGGDRGVLEPLKALFKYKGSRYMLGVAFIYSITSCLGKKAILLSSPTFFAPFYFSLLGVTLPLFYAFSSKKRLFHQVLVAVRSRASHVLALLPVFVGIGVLQALMVYSHMISISMTNAAYMITVKRTSLLFSILLGATLFGERPLVPRLLGGSLMLFGVFLVVTS